MRPGWIRLHRRLIRSDIAQSDELLGLFVRLLATVNFKKASFKGRKIEPGTMVFSWRKLPERLYPDTEFRPSINTLKLRLTQLEATEAIRLITDPTKRFSTITVVNWSKFQRQTVSKFDTVADTVPDTVADTDIRRIKKEKKTSPFDSVLIPDSLKADERFCAAWKEWGQHLKEKKVTRTPTFIRKLLEKCADWGVNRSIAAINHSIGSGYQGLFEPTGSKSKDASVKSKPKPDSRPVSAHEITLAKIRAEDQAERAKGIAI